MDNRKMLNLLRILSSKYNIQIIYAVEAGSKTYGLNSKESDNDIRFIYKYNDKSIYNEEIDNFRRAMKNETDITDMTVKRRLKTITGKDLRRNIDYQGWDVTFATKYLIENNPSIIEWIFTPIVYADDGIFCKNALNYIEDCDPKVRMMRHYIGFAKNVVDEIKEQRTIEVKTLLKFIRCLLMAVWFHFQHEENAVMNVELDVDNVIDDLSDFIGHHSNAIEKVIQHKKDLIDEYRMDRRFKKWLLDTYDWIDDIVMDYSINEINTDERKIKKIYKKILSLEGILVN